MAPLTDTLSIAAVGLLLLFPLYFICKPPRQQVDLMIGSNLTPEDNS